MVGIDNSIDGYQVESLPLMSDVSTLWPWSGTFKFCHTIYVKCEYFMNQKVNIVEYLAFYGEINGEGAGKSKKKCN